MVLPESGPTPTAKPRFLSMSISALKPACDWATVVNTPRTAEPTPDASSAASTGPLGFASSSVSRSSSSIAALGVLVVVVISSSPSSRDRGGLVDEGDEDARDSGGRKGDDEVRDEDFAHARLLRQTRSVIEDREGDDRGDDRREPRDVLLPLHTEGVPLSRARIGEEQRARAGRDRGAVPGIDDPGAGDDRQPGHDGHDRGADVEAGQPFAEAGDSDELWSQAVEARKPAREREQECRAQHHPVDHRPPLALGQLHSDSFLSCPRSRTCRAHSAERGAPADSRSPLLAPPDGPMRAKGTADTTASPR